MQLIKTDEEYEQALKQIDELMSKGENEKLENKDELEILLLLVRHYEDKIYKIDKPTAIEAIKFRMDQFNLKQCDMVPYFGSQSKVSEVLNNKRSLTLTMIKKLHKGLGISAEILIQ